MSVFFAILEKLIPLYFLILLGFFAGKVLHVRKESIASLLIYIIVPVVIFFGILQTDLSAGRLALPLFFFVTCCIMSLLAYNVAGRLFRSPTKNILAFAGGTANNGYFGLPVALFVFGEAAAGIVLLCALGFSLYESTLGFYITARGQETARQALLRVSRLPSLYAGVSAIAFNLTHVASKNFGMTIATSFRGTYTVLGMMMIGLGMSDVGHFKPDLRFIGTSFLTKFLFWPVAIGTVVAADIRWLHYWDPLSHRVMILLGCVPLAANTVAVASLLKTEPDKASMAVLASTLFALFFIPIVVALFLQ